MQRSIRRRHAAINFCVSLALTATWARADQQIFAFAVPDGFVSLKANGAAAARPDIDSSFIEEAKNFDAYAVHVGAEGVDATYTAKVFPGTVPLANLPELAAKAIQSNSALHGAKILSTRIVDVAGVRSGRVELENVFEGVRWRQVLFMLSARQHWAAVKLAAHHGQYELVLGRVEAAVLSIRGVAPPTRPSTAPDSVTPSDDAQGRFGVMLVVGALGGYFVRKILRRRKPGRRGA